MSRVKFFLGIIFLCTSLIAQAKELIAGLADQKNSLGFVTMHAEQAAKYSDQLKGEIEFNFIGYAAGPYQAPLPAAGQALVKALEKEKNRGIREKLGAAAQLVISRSGGPSMAVIGRLSTDMQFSDTDDIFHTYVGEALAITLMQTRLCDVDVTGMCLVKTKASSVLIGVVRNEEKKEIQFVHKSFNYKSAGYTTQQFRKISDATLLAKSPARVVVYTGAKSALEPFEVLVKRAKAEIIAEYNELGAELEDAVNVPKAKASKKINGFCRFKAELSGTTKRAQKLFKAEDFAEGKGEFICHTKGPNPEPWPVLVEAQGKGIGLGGSFKKKFPFFTRTTEETVEIRSTGFGVTDSPVQLIGDYTGLDATASLKLGYGGGLQTGLGIYVKSTPAEPDLQLSDIVLPLGFRVRKQNTKVALDAAVLKATVHIMIDPDSFFTNPDRYFGAQEAYHMNPALYEEIVRDNFEVFLADPETFKKALNDAAKSEAEALFKGSPYDKLKVRLKLGL